MSRNFYRHMRVKFTRVNKNRGDVWKAARKRKSGASFRFCVCASRLRNLRGGFFVLWGGWGEKKKRTRGAWLEGERKKSLFPPFPSSHRPPRAFNFFRLLLFYRDTQREPLWRRERSRDTFHTWIPGWKMVEKVYNNWYHTWASNVFTVWHKFSGEQSTNPGEISYKKRLKG